MWSYRFPAGGWVPAVRTANDTARCKEAGRLPIGKTPRIHDLRHTHASWLIAAGAPLPDVQARRGHENITTTVDTYGHLLPDAHIRHRSLRECVRFLLGFRLPEEGLVRFFGETRSLITRRLRLISRYVGIFRLSVADFACTPANTADRAGPTLRLSTPTGAPPLGGAPWAVAELRGGPAEPVDVGVLRGCVHSGLELDRVDHLGEAQVRQAGVVELCKVLSACEQ